MKCECGCGQETTISRRKSKRYIIGHNPKGNNSIKMSGKNNPNFGKLAWNTGKKCPKTGNKNQNGELNPNYRGGLPFCLICEKKLTNKKSKYCIKHRDRTGKNNPRWYGGKSFEPYCPKFTAGLKEEIRNKYDRKCFLCGKSEVENKRRLDVHHVDYDKEQGCKEKKWELVPLCMSCHTATTNSRIKYMNLIREKLKENKMAVDMSDTMKKNKNLPHYKEKDMKDQYTSLQNDVKLNTTGVLKHTDTKTKKPQKDLI